MNEITQDINKGAAKKKRIQGTEQLSVYRESCNILYMLVVLTNKTPRKMIRFTDKVIEDASEVIKCIALANQSRGEERTYYINLSIANATIVKSYTIILNRCKIISEDDMIEYKKMIKRLLSELKWWENSINREGQQ